MGLFQSLAIKNRHKRILSLIKSNWGWLVTASFCMMALAATSAATAYMVKPVLDDIFVKKNTAMLTLLPLGVFALFFLRGLADLGQNYFMSYVSQGIILRLRNDLYDRIMDLPISFFQKEKTGVLMSRITNDVNIVRTMVSTAVTRVIRDFFTIFFLTIVIFYRDWKMAAFAFFVLPVAFYPVIEFGRRVRKVSWGVQEAMAQLSAFLHETLAGNKIVKAFGMESYEKKRFFEKTKHLFNLEMKAVIVESLSSPVMEGLAGIGIAFIVWYGGSRVIEGTHTPGTFFSFMAAVLMLYDPVRQMSKLNNAIQRGLAATDRVFDIIETESDVVDPLEPKPMIEGRFSVKFENMNFKYDDELVLSDININVPPGEIVALVGMSGGGKTSLVNLLPRFYDVTSGAILFNDTDIRHYSLASLRRQIAIVTQEPILFNDTIRNNITYGKPGASTEEIEEAARSAYALDFIKNFPKGFETNIGELGSRLSGGEKQRICIARALIKNAPILILDEATSSLDTEAEMIVQKALENLMKGRTTFVIAHRLSTVTHADRILTIVNGNIVEEGRHEELVERGGVYYKLYKMQFKNGNE